MLQNIFNFKIMNTTDPVSVIGLNKEAQASYAWNLLRVTNKNILIVTNTLYEANSLFKLFSSYDNNNVLLFPMDDFITSEMVAVSPDLMAKRIETLNELVDDNSSKIVITNLMGYLRFLPTKKLWKSLSLHINNNSIFEKEEIVSKLEMLGYKRENLVTKTGEYANRGYILDVYPFGNENPVRIEFFGDEIDSIREFDPETQLSIATLNNIRIEPFSEFINAKGAYDIPQVQSFLPNVLDEVTNLSDYVTDSIIIYNDLSVLKSAYVSLLNDVLEYDRSQNHSSIKHMNDLIDVIPRKYIDILSVDNYKLASQIESYNTMTIDEFNGNFENINKYISNMLSVHKKVLVYLNDKKLITNFMNNIKFPVVISDENDIKLNVINIITKTFSKGFVIEDTVILTQNEIYSTTQNITYKSKFRYGLKIKDINKLKIGDYIVHSYHGIGKYLGIVVLTTKGMKKDYLHIQYANNDKLYIPVEKIENISKYSSNETANPKLNKLGSAEWQKQKARIRGKVKNIAKELISISAKRKMSPGFSFLPDDDEQYAFEKIFPYEETKDQLKAIKEIKQDMESPYPMDRLLCGDVGYGKTEVAFRAIFKAIKSGKQVAFLCPTTILSNQHYNNALERFKGFGVNIEVLNRFVTASQKKQIIENLSNGKIDLIIGTHRLLSKDIKYKDLGLLVIDEEQRFGVAHKEEIKKYKESIDILTLSATPIPRTLQMSLTGVRGLSLIETPPAYRYPVQTYVLKENPQVIKDAIYKEMLRNGQVFILYNNVAKIEDQVIKIKKLVPEARITYIHGQMKKDQIESTMQEFIDKKYDILVCTTIIETGIDIANVNTLIVLNVDYFGLSQLYQIRGRIGRGKNIAYAYLMYSPNKELNEVAVKRLNAIKEFTELGSGYALAVRDLAIRGSGDILGSEQSGFIDTIGYDMYLKILDEEIKSLKTGAIVKDDNDLDETPFIQVSTHIDDKYTEAEEIKIEIHKKINSIDTYADFESVKEELTDRFGKLNDDIIVYMLEELFQTNAKKKGIFKVNQQPNKIELFFNKDISNNVSGVDLLAQLFKLSPNFDVAYINKILKITLNTRNLDKHFLYYLNKMLDIIE